MIATLYHTNAVVVSPLVLPADQTARGMATSASHKQIQI
jgi:hypothetical protein